MKLSGDGLKDLFVDFNVMVFFKTQNANSLYTKRMKIKLPDGDF